MNSLITWVPGSLLLVAAAVAGPEEHAGHGHEARGAHVHGEAELLVAVDGRTLEIEFSSPAVNLVGFEHRPYTRAQMRAVERAAALLAQPGQLFGIPGEAGCELAQSDIESALLPAPHDGHEHATGHADFVARYRLECASPDRLDRLDVEVFHAFPGVGEMRAVTVSGTSQHSAELTARNARLDLREHR